MPRLSMRFLPGANQPATDGGRLTLKKEYTVPELEIIAFTLNSVCADVIHSSFEKGGNNSGWGFDNDDDDDNFGELT